MITKTTPEAWFLLANFHQARLLTAKQTETGRCRVSEIDAIESPIPLYRTQRPNGPHHKSSYGYNNNLQAVEEDRRRFVRQLAHWIDVVFKQHGIKRLTIFVPPRSIAYLREHLRHTYLGLVDLRDENLMYLTDDALPRHQAIAGLLHPCKDKERPASTTHLSNPVHATH